VEGGERQDGVEVRARRFPALEVRVDDSTFGKLPSFRCADGGELLAEFDAGDRIAGHGKWQRRLTSPASDLCETCLRRKLCEGNQVVEDLPRIVGTGAVVSSGACSRVVLRRSCGAFEHGSMMPERRLATTSLLAYALGRGRSETERLPFTVKAA